MCDLVIHKQYSDGLAGLTTGENILVLYWLDDVDREVLFQRRRDHGLRCGVFALRSPHRPKPIGAATVKIESITKGCIQVGGMDCLDGTSLLDIKPAVFPKQLKNNREQIDG
jgi:tRNA-Thr(GGU) m(6)t(6)A37 methyltransferase TsaA